MTVSKLKEFVDEAAKINPDMLIFVKVSLNNGDTVDGNAARAEIGLYNRYIDIYCEE